MSDNFYTLPPDCEYEPSSIPFSEIVDWGHRFLDVANSVWLHTKGEVNGKPLLVAVLDSGIDETHPDLRDGIEDAIDCTGSRSGPRDIVKHGTAVASIIGARANGTGIVGVLPKCKILSVKVLDDRGIGTDQSIFRGYQYALERGAVILNHSYGGPRMGPQVADLFHHAGTLKNRFSFAASGNDGAAVNTPARYPETIAVGAIDEQGRITNYTSRGPELDVLAPGHDILACAPGGGYQRVNGTSFGSPYAAAIGGAAWCRHQITHDKLETLGQMREHVQRGSKKSGQWGIINPKDMLASNDGELPVEESTWNFGLFSVHFPSRTGDILSIGK